MRKSLPLRQKETRWKQEQRAWKTRRLLRFTIYTLYFILLVFLVGFGWRVYGSLRKSVWDKKSRINLVFQTKPIFVVSLSPLEKRLDFLAIPPNTFIEVIHGFGSYRAESIYKLGELEYGQGGKLLAGSFQEYLGIPVDGYLFSDRQPKELGPQEARRFLEETMGDLFKLGKGTNLTRWDLIRLWWEVKKVRRDKVGLVNLGETSASSEVVLADGTKAIKIDRERLERIVTRLFPDERLRSEGLAIAVLNGTSHLGLARRAARIIANIGGRVVRIGEGKLKGKNCEVRSKKNIKKTYTVGKLKKIFDCQWGGEDLQDQRADVVLILGQRYWEKLSLR